MISVIVKGVAIILPRTTLSAVTGAEEKHYTRDSIERADE